MKSLPSSFCNLDRSIPECFEQVAFECKDNTAILYENQCWTYQELNERVNQVAHAIKKQTNDQNDCVAFLVNYSPNMVVTPLAVLKARKIYLAIHPQIPQLAQRRIVEDARPELMVTTRHLKDRAMAIAEGCCPILVLDEIDKNYSKDNLDICILPDDLSTIFYTSGSTGQPKGVVKNHRAVLHRVWLTIQQDGICPSDRQSLLTYSSFASSEADMFGSLLTGATLCLFDIVSRGFKEFYDWLENEKITVLHPPVLLFRRFLSTLSDEDLFPTLRLVLLAGDTVLPSDVNQWKYHFTKNCTLIHRFSTTETGLLTVLKIENDKIPSNRIVLAGFPVADKLLFLVDKEGRTVPQGQTGELVVKSAYLAQGYWRNPEKTDRVFSVDPSDPEQQIYRTGDLGQFQEDGSFKHIGRQDRQVKIRGYRVDLREIELALAQLTDIVEAAVITRTDNDEQKICAFLVLKSEVTFNPHSIRQHLLKILPQWAIPSHFQVIAALPLTPNGKIDRRALLAYNLAWQEREKNFVAPRNDLEKELAQIWEKVLGIHPISLTDNFFEMGGHSLLGIQLFTEIEKKFNRKLSLTNLLEISTIENLTIQLNETPWDAALNLQQITSSSAINLDDYRKLLSTMAGRPGLKPRPESLMTNLHAHVKKTPIFFFANGIGETLPLIPYFGQAQPFYFVESGYLVFHKNNKVTTKNIKALALHHLQDILTVQPDGDYHLVSYSFGSLVAYEIAKELECRGKSVTLVVLDAQGDNGRDLNYVLCTSIFQKLVRIKDIIRTKKWSKIYKEIGYLFKKILPKISLYPFHFKTTQNNNIERKYTMEGYKGKIHLFIAQDRIKASRRNRLLAFLFPYYGWDRRSVESITLVPGNHLTMYQEPNAKRLAEKLAIALKIAEK